MFEKVTSFVPGGVYAEGCYSEFQKLLKFGNSDVLYMGDHIQADLMEPRKMAVWKTAAIIKELEHEISQMSTPGLP